MFNLAAQLQFSAKGIKESLDASATSFDRLQDSMSKAGKNMADMADGVRNVGLAGSAMAAGVGVAINEYVSFDKEFQNSINRISDGKENIGALEESMKTMAITGFASATDIAKAMELMGKSGYNAKQAMAAMPGIINLASFAGTDLKETTDEVTDAIENTSAMMAKYGDKVQQTQKMTDMLAWAQKNGEASAMDIAQALNKSGSIMTNLGVPINEMIGAISHLSSSGMDSQKASMGMVMMFEKLAGAASDDKMVGMMAEMGIAIDDIKTKEGKLKSLPEVISIFQKGMARIPDKTKRAEVAMDLFGAKGQDVFFKLAQAGEENLKTMFAEIEGASGTSADALAEKTSTMAGMFTLVGQAAKGIFLEIGNMATKTLGGGDLLRPFVTGVQSLALALIAGNKPMGQWDDKQKELMAGNFGQFALGIKDALITVKDAISSVVKTVGGFLGSLGQGGDGLRTFAKAMTYVVTGMILAGPPLLAVWGAVTALTPVVTAAKAAIFLFGNGFTMVQSVVGIFGNALIGLGKLTKLHTVTTWLSTAAQWAWTTATKAIAGSALFAAAQTAYLWTVQKVGAMWTGIITAAQWAWNVALNANPIGLVVLGIAALIGAGILLYQNWELVKSTVIGVWENLGVFRYLLLALMGPVGWFIAAGVAIYRNWETVSSVLKGVWEILKKIVNVGIDSIKGIFSFFGGKGNVDVDMSQKKEGAVTNNMNDFAKNMDTADSSPKIMEPSGNVGAASNVDAEHLNSTSKSASPNVNVSSPNVNVSSPTVNLEVVNTVDANGINTIVRKAQSKQAMREGKQLEGISMERQSQVAYGR